MKFDLIKADTKNTERTLYSEYGCEKATREWGPNDSLAIVKKKRDGSDLVIGWLSKNDLKYDPATQIVTAEIPDNIIAENRGSYLVPSIYTKLSAEVNTVKNGQHWLVDEFFFNSIVVTPDEPAFKGLNNRLS